MNKTVLPVEYSVASAQSLLQYMAMAYELPSGSKVSFFHQGRHDTYFVSNGAIHLMLRIYRKGWKSLENVRAELDTVLLLKQKGIDVSVPYRDREGHYIQELSFPEGSRYAVLFMYAPGVKLTHLSEPMANLFGKKLAALHLASMDMEEEHLQHAYYLGNVFNSTMEAISGMFTSAKVIDSFGHMYMKMDSILNSFDTDTLRIGICHGDYHFENAHFKIESSKVTLFDFDFCGNGYLLYDVGTFCHYQRGNSKNIDAFLNGYKEVLPLSQTEVQLIPFFTLLRSIFHLGARVGNADGSKNPLWAKSEIETRMKEIEKEVNTLAEKTGVTSGHV